MSKWTIMVYIVGDDVLDNFAVESLKQLKRAATEDIVVVAQFDPNTREEVRRYVFPRSAQLRYAELHSDGVMPPRDQEEDASIENNRVDRNFQPKADTATSSLTDFIVWGTQNFEADHHALVLNGHGPELLFDDKVSPDRKEPKYFTAQSLRDALRDALKDPKVKNSRNSGPRLLDIIAFDACCMATVEFATAVQGYAQYMIASQDEVPDASLPYERLLDRLKPEAGDVGKVSRMAPQAYKEAYEDYIATAVNGLRGITLSTLSLEEIDTITNPLKQLADALLKAAWDDTQRKKILGARSKSHDFEFGIFVDLCDFCQQLEKTRPDNKELERAVEQVQAAISRNSGFIVENKAHLDNSDRCHGISVYFPYEVPVPDRKNLPYQAEDFELTKNGTNRPVKARLSRIQDLEDDFAALKDDSQTNWIDFIQRGWSVILAKEVPDKLDEHYSGEQCARNLLRLIEGPGKVVFMNHARDARHAG